jgi:hypothetical protein
MHGCQTQIEPGNVAVGLQLQSFAPVNFFFFLDHCEFPSDVTIWRMLWRLATERYIRRSSYSASNRAKAKFSVAG